jgi:hypothetical protein
VTAALIGLLGIILGLAIGRGYGFWAGRRQELGEAAIAAAAVGEELLNQEGSSTELQEIWREHRRWLVIHMSPHDYRLLACAVGAFKNEDQGPFPPEDLIKRIEALYELFWEEHEKFILVPLFHYLRGNTVSKRVREILDPARDIEPLPGRGERSAIRAWHGPSEPPS